MNQLQKYRRILEKATKKARKTPGLEKIETPGEAHVPITQGRFYVASSGDFTALPKGPGRKRLYLSRLCATCLCIRRFSSLVVVHCIFAASGCRFWLPFCIANLLCGIIFRN